MRPESGAWRADGSMRPNRQRGSDGARRRPQRKRERQLAAADRSSEFSEEEVLKEVKQQRKEAQRAQRLARRALELRAEMGELDALRELVRSEEDAQAFAKGDIGRRRHERKAARSSLKSRKVEGRNTMFSYLS